MTDRMIKSELWDKLTDSTTKNAEPTHTESTHSEGEFATATKAKYDIDHSSSTSKQPSVQESPPKSEDESVKMCDLNLRWREYSNIMWYFLSEKYAPYLALLQDCSITSSQYGPIVRDTLEKHFWDILCIEYKELVKYCKEQSIDKLDMLVLQFGLQITKILSQGVTDMNDSWKEVHSKELAKVKFLYERIKLSVQIKSSCQDTTDKHMEWINSLLTFYAIVFEEGEDKLDAKELIKKTNLPALRLAKSFLGESEAGKLLDKYIGTSVINVTEKAKKNVERKRRLSPKRNILTNSQDPNDMLRLVRKKRSQAMSIIGEVSLDEAGSPNTNSMGFYEYKSNRAKRYTQIEEDYCQTQTVENLRLKIKESEMGSERKSQVKQSEGASSQYDNTFFFTNKLHPESRNTSVTRKQDKSKIHKFSPLKIKENNIQQKIKRKSLSRKGGSNSFLGSALPQKAKMAIQKGRKEDKKKKLRKLGGALGLISQTSFALAKEKENQKWDSSCQLKEAVYSDLPTEQKDIEMVDENSDEEKVIVINTPSKSDLMSQEQIDNEFWF